ncbi:hypothetical protein [Ancylomarina sp. 16SWW S1-10-2]|uniref:hypothetical protein n=1 Tax=Ancylomarina sp. 16SWW S1-10-2 TaxID=2499681 RepID=UPI0012AD3D92|nr:hypothetical protein [Ancylomarina sp. 16SWW S1-10-2]MRT93924.1 hypothetical protein [Ancylomarina sp. 16SWW S1-10-2]
MKKILFPFQLNNEIYLEAFIIAAEFARKLNVELILLNVFSLDVDNNITQDIYNKMIKNKWIMAYNEVAKFNAYYLSKHAKIKDEIKVKLDRRFIYGNEIEEIKKIIIKEDIDLVVFPLSKDKRYNKKHLEIMDSDIFHNNFSSALVLPLGYKFKSIHNMAFSTDLKERNHNEFYLNKMLSYARVFNAGIHFVHINTNKNNLISTDNKTYKYINEIVTHNKKHSYKTVSAKGITATIQSYITSNHISLISVVNEDLNLISSIFHKSISKEMLEISEVPVLFMIEKTN